MGQFRYIESLWIGALASALLLVAPATSRSQSTTVKFDRITSEHGLSDNYVLCSLQDRYGFIWFGTRDGLNRYDGYSFTIYRHDAGDAGSISDGAVDCIFEDHAGMLWIGTHSGGLNLFDRVRNRFIHYRHDPTNPKSISAGRITSICEDREGDLWIATIGSKDGMSRLDRRRGAFIRYRANPHDPRSLSSNDVTAVCSDHEGNVWVATGDAGLNRYDRARAGFINHHDDRSLSFDSLGVIEQLYFDGARSIWMRNAGTFHLLDIPTGAVTDYARLPHHLDHRPHYPTVVFRDRMGATWVGTSYTGIDIHGNRWEDFLHLENNPCNGSSLVSNRIFCITEDNAGNIWIGTEHGLNRINRRSWQFRYYEHDPCNSNTIAHRVVRSILRDDDGTLWIGTGSGGLNRIDSGASRVIHYQSTRSNPRTLSEDNVNVLYRDREGELWIGTNGGLNRFIERTQSFERYLHDPKDPRSISCCGIWGIMEDREGTLWIGTLGGGLNRFDRRAKRFTHFVHDPADPTSLSHNYVLCMYEDRSGTMWVGTDDGLNKFDRATGRFTHYRSSRTDPNSLSNDRIWYLYEDRRGYLWIATSGGGVNRFDPKSGAFRRYTEKEGLADNTVCAIEEDDRGRIWISTSKGLSRLDPVTNQFHNYTADDGLYVYEFHFKSCFKDREGYLYFGGANGVVRFHPDSLNDNSHVPPIALTAFRVFDSTAALDTAIMMKRELVLDYSSNFFSIEFASLDFSNPRRNRFRYMLEGFDDNWREAGDGRRSAEYTNVPPGTYTFRVLGSNNNGVWNNQGSAIRIIITPAYWQTWWFRAGAALAACGLITTLVLVRIRSVRRKGDLERMVVEYQLKTLRAQMNPHFIFNSLNAILHFIMAHDAESAHLYLSKVSKLIRATLEHSKSDAIPLADELATLQIYLDLERLRFDDRFTGEVTIDPTIDTAQVSIPPMLIQPYVENAIKHGLAPRETSGKVMVDIRRSSGSIVCSIIDDGIGRKGAELLAAANGNGHTSRGMEISRERLDVLSMLSGEEYKVEVTDLYDQNGGASGTRVDIHIPDRTAPNGRVRS